MSADHIDRAAEVVYVEVFGLPDYSPDAVDDHNRHSYRGDCECNASDRADARHAAEKLDAAGLLASPEHDAAVAAEWADHFEVRQGAVGSERLTVESMIAALRGPRPFGRMAGESDADT